MFLPKIRSRKPQLRYIKADDILPNPHQPRRSIEESELCRLSESIRRNGIFQPLLVCRREDGCFELITGERRLLAARRAALSKVPCIIVPAAAAASAVAPISDSVHTTGPDIFEEAAAIRRFMDSFRLSRSAAAAWLGLSESAVAAKLSLLRFNDAQRSRALAAGISQDKLKSIAALEPEKRDAAFSALFAEKSEEKEPRRKINGFGDLRLFDNSINRMIESLCSAGIQATCNKRTTPAYSEYIVRISRSDSPERQLTLF